MGAFRMARPTNDVLPRVVPVESNRTTIILHSGIIRVGPLGVNAALIGRTMLYGTSAAGQAGAETALSVLRTEFEKTMV